MQTKTLKISIPTDSEGFVGRACNAPSCSQYFKIYAPDHGGTLHCPYCGVEFSRDVLFTSEQLDHAKKVVVEDVRADLIETMQSAFKRAAHGSEFLTYKPGPPPRRRSVQPSYAERQVDTELQCADCATRFQVYGIFGYCPGCNCQNLQIYDANRTIIKRKLSGAEDEHRQLRHAYSDLVSTFEVFCRRKAIQITTETGRFQKLFDARKFFKRHTGTDILANLSSSELLALRRVFQKRHVCVHSGGTITERYVKTIPEDKDLLGTQAALSAQELDDGANAIRIALGDLVKTIERPG